MVVQHDPSGLDVYTQADSVLSKSTNARSMPVANPTASSCWPTPSSTHRSCSPRQASRTPRSSRTCSSHPTADLGEQDVIARDSPQLLEQPPGGLVGATGTIPLQAAQGRIVTDSLPTVELATLAVIALIVGISFRSAVAPVITLITALCRQTPAVELETPGELESVPEERLFVSHSSASVHSSSGLSINRLGVNSCRPTTVYAPRVIVGRREQGWRATPDCRAVRCLLRDGAQVVVAGSGHLAVPSAVSVVNPAAPHEPPPTARRVPAPERAATHVGSLRAPPWRACRPRWRK
ncbi:MAG: putative drug exporter of the superfamily [Pseudonocardia sp.]